VREQRIVLEHGVDVAPVGRHALGGLPEDLDMAPRSAARSPAISRRQVVLPEPDGPSMAKNSPSAISRSTPSTARTGSEMARDVLEATAAVMGDP
jgi:hypothetical protein